MQNKTNTDLLNISTSLSNKEFSAVKISNRYDNSIVLPTLTDAPAHTPNQAVLFKSKCHILFKSKPNTTTQQRYSSQLHDYTQQSPPASHIKLLKANDSLMRESIDSQQKRLVTTSQAGLKSSRFFRDFSFQSKRRKATLRRSVADFQQPRSPSNSSN